METLPKDAVHLFASRRGGGHFTTTQVYRSIAKAGDMIGNDSIGTHTMRKTFGYTYYQATKDVATLMEIFNHSSQKMTLRYIGITEESIENSIRNISFY
ncbi:tyrosine-type recombinase/integrase [Lysinibacillus fusiformis]